MRSNEGNRDERTNKDGYNNIEPEIGRSKRDPIIPKADKGKM